jgi:DNA repair protein RecN (Recombination protein N)
MLTELVIKDFAIIDELRICFEPGLNVLTGETGAGKSIIIDALGAVLGERIGPDVVRSGAKTAIVEAIFDVSRYGASRQLAEFAAEFGLDLEDGTVILAREISANGRSTARVNGRATTATSLQRVGTALVDIHGQSDHLSLLAQAEQLNVLDRFAGTGELRTEFARLVYELRGVRAALEALISGARERERRIDLLTFQSGEIEEANLYTDEEERLTIEREVLENAERLAEEAALAHSLLAGAETDGDDSPSAVEAMQRASTQLDAIVTVDPAIAGTADRLREMVFLLQDVVAETRDYRDRIEADPTRLEQIEVRLDLIHKLKRKYGATVEEIIQYGIVAAEELSQLTGGEEDAAALQERERRLLDHIGSLGSELSLRRRSAATELERGVESTVAELNMGRSRFAVAIDQRESATGAPVEGDRRSAFDDTGMDRVEFLLAANADEQLKPLARVASGGEMARLMLALKSILANADETPTLVFDEIDVGVGGRSGQVVGEKLWGLTRDHQVVVITHLPQIAAFAESHFRITKAERAGRAVSSVALIEGEERIDELAAMVDGEPVTPAARENARQMMERATAWKSGSSIAA